MKKLLPLLINLFKVNLHTLMALLLFGAMLLAGFNSNAQVYYVTNDGKGTAQSADDGIHSLDYQGGNKTDFASNFTPSPILLQVDLQHNRAFIYEAYTTTPPNGIGIKVVNLTTGAIIKFITLTIPVRIQSIRYDPVNDYIYYVTQDATTSVAGTNDALWRVKPDGTGSTSLVSGFCKNPTFLALDPKNNRAFVYENLFADHSLVVINLADNSVTRTIPTVAASGPLVGVDCAYDPVTDYIYMLTSENTAALGDNDALFKVHPDGTGQTTVKSKVSAQPSYCMAADFGHNKIYYADGNPGGSITTRSINSVDLTTGAVSTLLDGSRIPAFPAIVTGLWAPDLARLSTATVSNISSTTVTMGGSVTYSDIAVTETGIVYSSTNTLPVIGTDQKQAIGSGTGSFSGGLNGLSPVTLYYARAYATSAAGTSYGDVKSFTTLSNNAYLTSLALSSGTLSPVFSGITNAYTANVTYNVTSITLTPVIAQANATVKVNNTTVASGSASGALSLNPGSNIITTVVTAQDGITTKIYTTTITKDKTPQAITFNSIPAVTYGAADFTLGAVAASTLPVSYTSDNANVATVTSAGLVHIVGVGTVNITASQAGNTTYLAATNVSQQLTVNKAVLTYTADAASRDYGAANPTFTGSVSGFVNGDSKATATTGTMVFTSTANATSPVTTDNTKVIKYPITGSGLSAANYSFVQATANSTALTLNKIVITYTAQPATKVYGAANPLFNVVFTGLANGQTIDQVAFSFAYATTATESSPIGSYPVTVNGLDALNYTFTPAASNTTIFTITKANLTFTAQAASKHYGEANPSLSGAITGYVNNETAATALAGTPVYNTTATTTSSVGGYPITLSGVTAANYNLIAAAANNTALTIAKNTLSYVATPASRAFNTANPSVTGTITGFLNGDTQASATTGTLSFSTAVTLSTPVGTYAINGSGLSSANYNIAQDASNASAFSIFLSTNGNLSSLSISQGSLSPSFASGTNNYTATVATGVTSLTLTPTLSDVNAGVTVNGNQVTSGASSGAISLNVGPNIIPVNVTAQDGTTTNPYNITVTRLPSSDATLNSFSISTGTLPSPDIYNVYRTSVGNTLTSFDLTAIVHESNATLTVNGTPFNSGTPVTLPLSLGDNTYNVVITAQDGTTQNYYGLVINRAFSSNNLLSSLAVSTGSLSPAFGSGVNNYTVQVSNATTSIDITPAYDVTALASINGYSAPSGIALTTPLAVGDNAVPITVVAQNGASNTYNVNVQRVASTDATLAGLGIITTNSGLDVPFDSGTYTYNTTVTGDVTAFILKPIATNDGSTITINGAALNTANGNAITLQYFSAVEPMVIVVTAGDGTTQKTYTVNVTRNFSTNNLLQSLTMNINGTITPLIPVFDPATNDYTMVISDPNVTGIVIAPVAQDSHAEVRVGGALVNVGASRFVALQGGVNVIPVNVLSFGGGNNTYNITINRAYSSNAGLINVILSGNAQYSAIINQTNNNLTATIPNNVTAISLIPNASDPGGTVITVNGYAISGGASGSLPLAVGDNVFTVGITAADNSNTQYYTVHAIRLPFTDVTLSSLTVDKGVLAPAFSPGTTSYTVVVANSDNAITVTPVASAAGVTVTAGGQTIDASTPSYTNSALFEGNQRIPVRVTAPDGVNFTTYALNVLRPSVNQAYLGNIVLSSGAISPAFSRNTVNYTATVAGNVSSVNFTPATAEANATITVTNAGNTTTINAGTPSVLIPLNAGANTVTTNITSQDGSTTKTYTVTITRTVPSADATLAGLNLSTGTLSPVFSSSTDTYTANVNYATGSITVTPATTNANAVITVRGLAVVSGSGLSVALNQGSNAIPVVVTAEDGSTTKTYTLTVNRAAASADATLASLGINATTISPVFTAGTTSYTAVVGSSVSSITLSAFSNEPNATVLVNGTAPDGVTGTIDIPINAGANNIAIAVTAEDGIATRTYTVTVSKKKSSDAALTLIAVSGAVLTRVGTTDHYTTSVSSSVTSIQQSATLSESHATFTVNNIAATSGTATTVALNATGTTDINNVVTAEDGIATRTYTVTVTKKKSSDAALTLIAVSGAVLTRVGTTDHYTTSVSSSVTSIQQRATLSESHATFTVNNIAATSGAATTVALNATGATDINTVVTAEDGIATRTYTVTVTKKKSSDAALTLIAVSGAVLTRVGTTDDYTTSIDSGVTSIQQTVTLSDSNATVTVNGTAANAGVAIPVTIDAGATTVTTVVTAEDGVTTRTYTVVINKVTSSNAPLTLALHTLYDDNSAGIAKKSNNITNSYDIIVHQAVSPNGDGLNDYLNIEGIEKYADNHLSIMNAAGALVYDVKGYGSNGNLFDGHSNKSGSLQKPGTYYYSLEYKDGAETKRKTGYIVLKY
ncbi:cadherin-like beta sandwich domain-containing protein [Mucilaginibacter sp.]|uniref:cadherin-like beta sandwich domain-containing protein n=1 Tax=Mucilaginibacter sp. TaxID=1882438 RepID=UPI0025DB39B8|nr:cadherin-like beta sandwich domain-containing protein [Mucilaginibacter sp.]